MNDRIFLAYCHSHCQTEIGAFSKEHVARLLRLSGDDENAGHIDNGKDWWHLGEEQVWPLVEAAEKRLDKHALQEEGK